MNIISTIVPVFVIIFLGLYAKHRGFFTQDFLNQANRLVYYIAIPAMIFSAVSKASLKTEVHVSVILITLFVLMTVAAAAFGLTKALRMPRQSKGSFIQSSFHGNLGYIAFAVAFYYLGNKGFVKAAIIAGFVMIFQNILAVFVLQYHSRKNEESPAISNTLKKTMANPVILSALAGIIFSFFNIPLPIIIDRSLDILKGMGLPMALLIIGASLSFQRLKAGFMNVLISTFIKLILAPAMGLLLFRLLLIDPDHYLPAMIVLASPTATLTYIMAKEIGGDPDFAVAAISICTLVSSITYGMWLSIG
ncbi:MAG: transporter [Desulfobacterales bacterium RIFOXYA12_FULL_46_15]|nr:MAG: transporter [Desulfobacterales bacterium RIFOXYA12_FULL_46_15]